MTSQYSPSVIPTETDFSDYAVRSSTTILAVVGHALKGPIEKPYLISSEAELIEVFGNAEVATVALAGGDFNFSANIITDCIQYLRQGNQLYVIRATGPLSEAAYWNIEDTQESAETYLTLTAVSPGAWTQNYVVTTLAATNGDAEYFNISIANGTGGPILELFQNLAGPTASPADPTNLPEARMNGVSSIFTVKANTATNTHPEIGPISRTNDGVDDRPELADINRAVNLLADTELYTVNLIAIPQAGSHLSIGLASKAEWNSAYDNAITVCEGRGECMLLMDPYYSDVVDTTPTSAKNKLMEGGTGLYDFDSSQCALYGPWLQVYDGYNRKSVWVGPACVVAGQYAFNDRVAQAWFAPAGLNRGKLRLVQDVSVLFTKSDLEGLQAPRMITNPIRPIINEGITIWGQRTGQRKATALNRVNARRMLNSAKHTIATAVRVLLFEPNDTDTWLRFKNIVNPAMQYIKDTRGVYEFRVICDESTNPPAQIDQNIMRGKILLKPTKTAETIYVDFSVLNTGADFDEFV
jgi:hypothetical protein